MQVIIKNIDKKYDNLYQSQGNIAIIDNDVNWDDLKAQEQEEDAPLVVNVVDSRSDTVKRKQDGWKKIGVTAKDKSPMRSIKKASPARRTRKDSTPSDSSPPRRKATRRDSKSPQRRRRKDSSSVSPPRRTRMDSDTSPPRKKSMDSEKSPPRRKRKDSDTSPPRRKRVDSEDSPLRRRRKDSDASPPRRKRIDSDESPHRRKRIYSSSDDEKRNPRNGSSSVPFLTPFAENDLKVLKSALLPVKRSFYAKHRLRKSYYE